MQTTKRYGVKADEALSMWVKLARTFATFNKLATEHIKTFGLTEPQFGVLECLGHLGAMPMCELGRKQLASGGNITVIVDNLEKSALVARTPSIDDRRTIMVQLTSKGKKLFEEIFPEHAHFVSQLATVLSPDEQEQLSGLLKKLGVSLAEAHDELCALLKKVERK